MKTKILLVYGTRPEAIKMAPLAHTLKGAGVNTRICVTAQHRQMLDQVNQFFEITPDIDLNIMQAGQSLNSLASRLLIGLDEVLAQEKPDWVLVHGDTTTSTAAAWAAFHRGCKVGHVEAGLRTHNKYAPFPEEINRQITGRIADLHFAPTSTAQSNLIDEGIDKNKIYITGNTVIDALYWGIKKLTAGYINEEIASLLKLLHPNKRTILVTGHRRENFGDGFESICQALSEIALHFPDVQIVYPVHLNPSVQEPVRRVLSKVSNVHLIEPLGYPAFLWLMSKAYLILTDSGGVQEEAPSLGKPVLVMRETTERPEAVEAKTVKLVGSDREKIVDSVSELLQHQALYIAMSKAHNPYGDGKACKKILKYLVSSINTDMSI